MTDNPKTPLYSGTEKKNVNYTQSKEKQREIKSDIFQEKPNMSLAEKLDYRIKLVLCRRRIVNAEFFLAMSGILLMVIEAELYINYIVSKSDMTSFLIKFIISISTALLLVAVCLDYYVTAKIRALDAGSKSLTSVMTTRNWVSFVIELIVCSLHPFPGNFKFNYASTSGVVHQVSVDSILSIAMLSRMYMIGEFAVVHSNILTDTFIYSIGVMSRTKIGTSFVFKALMNKRPVFLLLVVMGMTVVVNTWAFRACELYFDRNKYNKNSFFESLWLITMVFLSSDHGDTSPESYCGRYVSVVTAVFGLITTALLIAIITQQVEQTRNEKYVFAFASRVQSRYRKKSAAANAIKSFFKITLLQQRGKDKKKDIDKYKEKLRDSLKLLRSTKEEMNDISEDMIGVVDVAEVTKKLDQRVATLEQKLESISDKIDILLSAKPLNQ